MSVKSIIANRRSIRKYQDKEIPQEVLLELIEAARLAPSATNAQPWKYKIITSSEEKELLKKNSIFKQDFVYRAPAIIVCCSDPEAFKGGKLEEELEDTYEQRAVIDLALSSQNLVLMAEELGLGTCYIGWMGKKKIKSVLNIPERYVVTYVITVGYPAEEPEKASKKSIDKILI